MKRWVKIVLNVGYWLMYLLLLLSFLLLAMSAGMKVESREALTGLIFGWIRGMTLFAVIPGVISFYLGYGVLFPRFLLRRRMLFFFSGLVITALLSAVISLAASSLAVKEYSLLKNAGSVILSQLILLMFISLVNAIIGVVLRGFITSYDDISVKEELARRSAAVEMELVRAQLNPHFLFNTIHNIDILMEKNPGKASDYLVKLSEIMRYMLYESKDEYVGIRTETEYIRKYVMLQRIRTSIPDFAVLEVKENDRDIPVAPMTFIPFVENAFKYAEHSRTGNAVVIRIEWDETKVYFYCRNRKGPVTDEKRKGGLGNALIRRRLELLYPEKHRLQCVEEEDFYEVTLVIPG